MSFAHTALSRIDWSEVAVSLWSFSCFFCVLCATTSCGRLRDGMGVQGGVENLPRLFSATLSRATP